MLQAYDYKIEKPRIFTEDGQALFMKMWDRAKELISVAGAARAQEIMKTATGDTFLMVACLDRMVEMNALVEITSPEKVWGQFRIFVLPQSA